MVNKNQIQIIGNIGNDAECKVLEGGKGVVSLSVATSETYKNAAGDKVTSTEWHRLELWRNKGEDAEKVAAMLTKGKSMLFQGKMTYGSYKKTFGEEEVTFHTATINVSDFLFLDKKPEGNGTTSEDGEA